MASFLHEINIGKHFKYWNKPQIQFKAVKGKTMKNKMRENEDQMERKTRLSRRRGKMKTKAKTQVEKTHAYSGILLKAHENKQIEE